MEDTLIETPLLIAGAIYEQTTPQGEVEQFVCFATKVLTNRKEGMIRRYGYCDERIIEGSEAMVGWKLIWAPNQDISPRTGKPTRKYAKKAKTENGKASE